MKKRRYNYRRAEFILEPLSDALVRVTHREQTGYIGITRNWDAGKPYSWTFLESTAEPGGVDMESMASPDGIEGNFFSHSTPEQALKIVCDILLDMQRKEDSKRVNLEERKRIARQVLREFLEGLPE